MMASLLIGWRTVSSSSCCENTGIGCQLYLLFHSMDVPFGGKKLANTVCMDMCVRGTPVACACTNCWVGEEVEAEDEKEKEKKRERNWVMRQERLSFAICKRPHYQTPIRPNEERGWERVSGGSLAPGYLHRDCSRVPEICHNAYAANYQCWTARVCHSERWFIARRGRMARETTAGAFTK